MPARHAPLTLVIPGGFDPRWSPVGRALHRCTGDRLRAEALLIVFLTGTALAGLMGVYGAEAAATLLALPPLALAGGVAAGAGLLLGMGVAGRRPRAVVAANGDGVTVVRGRERVHLSYAALADVQVVEARTYHRHHRRYAAVRPFLGSAAGPVLLLRAADGRIVALGLGAEDRAALQRHAAAPRAEQPGRPTPHAPAAEAES